MLSTTLYTTLNRLIVSDIKIISKTDDEIVDILLKEYLVSDSLYPGAKSRAMAIVQELRAEIEALNSGSQVNTYTTKFTVTDAFGAWCELRFRKYAAGDLTQWIKYTDCTKLFLQHTCSMGHNSTFHKIVQEKRIRVFGPLAEGPLIAPCVGLHCLPKKEVAKIVHSGKLVAWQTTNTEGQRITYTTKKACDAYLAQCVVEATDEADFLDLAKQRNMLVARIATVEAECTAAENAVVVAKNTMLKAQKTLTTLQATYNTLVADRKSVSNRLCAIIEEWRKD